MSLNALIVFLDKAAGRGDLKTATANALKASCNKVFSILSDNEKQDLSTIDLDQTFGRFKNRNDDLNPDSLKTYRSRTNKAVTEFLKFREDPENWKPSISQRAKKAKQNTNGRNENEYKKTSLADRIRDHKRIESDTLTHNYPLRSNITITISGLPRDLKSIEAKRLSAFLQALCEDYEPGA